MRHSVSASRLHVMAFIFAWLLPSEVLPQTAREGQTVSLNGMEMYFETLGQGEPLVLLHGFLENGHLFDPLVDDLATHYRLVIPDLRGHGGSTNPSGQFTMHQSALDIFALMDHLGIESAKAIGISTGAMTLLHMATQQPERVEAMVLVGTGIYYPAACRERLAATSADTYPESGWSRLRRLHRHGDDQIRSLLDLFGSFASDYEDMAFTPPGLSTIRARTLIVNGDQDWCFPAAMAAEMAESIPSAYLWVIPNGRHVPILRGWSRTFAATAVAFLGGNLERG